LPESFILQPVKANVHENFVCGYLFDWKLTNPGFTIRYNIAGKKPDYSGLWSGATDQGKAISFLVEEVNSYDITEMNYFVDLNGNICQESINGIVDNILVLLSNNECNVNSGPGDFSIEFQIYFDSDTKCHGTWSALDSNCDADNSGNFTACKDVDCSDEDKDGYYAEDDCGTEVDCNDSDPELYPEVGEIEACLSGCEYSSIQSAIDAAGCENTISVDDGTYYESIDYLGKNITVRSKNGPASTFIDGKAGGSVVSFISGEELDSVLDGFSIINGTGTSGGYYTYGGGIYCKSSSPTINNCIISSNLASNGGGICCCSYASSITSVNITSCTISGNMASSMGGGIYFMGCSAVMVNSILWGNASEIVGDDMSIFLSDSSIDITHSDIEEGWSGPGNIGEDLLLHDPLFMAPQAAASAPTALGDYHLQPGSACIDAGDPASALHNFPAYDIEGEARPQGLFYDMGADEV
jgi:hypothetical protein